MDFNHLDIIQILTRGILHNVMMQEIFNFARISSLFHEITSQCLWKGMKQNTLITIRC